MDRSIRFRRACSLHMEHVRATRGLGSSSLSSARVLIGCCALLAASLYIAFMAQTACAATWPVSTSALSASVSFHQSYSAGNDSYVHSGIDIPASAGMQISAPLAGTVRFTGSVPSGDSRLSGSCPRRTMSAVSVEVADGKVVTLMPFDVVNVRSGQCVSEGDALGTLARDGDISSAGAHLHMGYKRGRECLDPMLLFGISAPGFSEERSEAAVSPSEVMSMLDASAASKAFEEPASAMEGVEVPVADASFSYAPKGQAQQSSSPAMIEEPSFGTIETGSYVQRQGLQQGSYPFSAISGAWDALSAACSLQLDSLVEALSSAAEALHVPMPMMLAGVSALAIGAVAFLFVAGFKLIAPHAQQLLQAKGRSAVCRLN